MAQLNLRVGDLALNQRLVQNAAVAARDALEAQAIVFPELTLTGYPPEDLLLRGSFLDDVEAVLSRLMAEVRGIDVILGYPKRRDGRLYNMCGLIRDGVIKAEYSKALLPNYGVFDEKRYFTPGDSPCVVEIAGLPVGLTICEDIWQPGPTKAACAAGAKLILNLNASPYHQGKTGSRIDVVGARARECGVPVLYANLVGGQDELVFDGSSFAVDAHGRLQVQGAAFKPELVPVELDADGGLLPGHCSAQPDELESVYQALVMGVRDYVGKSGFSGAVLGLSGGIDSALTLAIAVDALGAENVEAVSMPSRYTADMSNDDAELQAKRMGVRYRSIPIEPVFQSFLGLLEAEFAGLPADVTEENIQARCRGIILMAISNKTGKMLLTTGNKSEMSVGYATLYGDMAGGFAPLKDVFKTLVFRLALWRNKQGEVIPPRVIERPPSAELRPDQKDTDSLPAYDILDAVLARYVEQDRSLERIIAEGFDPQVVARILRMVDRNEYKRRQAPPGVKVTERAYGRDRRYPIINGYQ